MSQLQRVPGRWRSVGLGFAAGLCVLAGNAIAQQAGEATGARLDYASLTPEASLGPTSGTSAGAKREASAAMLQGEAPVARYGAEGSRWWTIGGGVANDFSDATDLNLFGAYSYFLIDDVEFSAELGAWYYAQTGDDTAGLNPNMILRWHFYNDQDWTVYADVGIGLVFTADDVPPDGTSINFTPRAGLGFTHALDDSGTRLMVGVRWAHISNARIEGDGENPSRDSVMGYVGVIWPF